MLGRVANLGIRHPRRMAQSHDRRDLLVRMWKDDDVGQAAVRKPLAVAVLVAYRA